MSKAFCYIMFGLSIFIILSVLFNPKVKAHSWYDPLCCNNNDCAPVLKSVIDNNGNTTVTTKHGTITIPKTFPRKPSQDEKEHACFIGTYLYCYYVPGGS